MNNLTLIAICCLLTVCCVKAAFKDFVIGPDTKEPLHSNDLDFGCEADAVDYEEQEQHYIQQMLQAGVEDPQMLLNLLMQHAQRLGLSLEQLAQMQSMEENDVFNSQLGCNADESQQPRWYDVFFN